MVSVLHFSHRFRCASGNQLIQAKPGSLVCVLEQERPMSTPALWHGPYPAHNGKEEWRGGPLLLCNWHENSLVASVQNNVLDGRSAQLGYDALLSGSKENRIP